MKQLLRCCAVSAALIAVCLIPAHSGAVSAEKTIVCFGDSITAGYGLDPNDAWPAALSRLLMRDGHAAHVVNRGVSGDTTKDAVARLGGVLALKPDLVVVEFGGNDGLRGLPLSATRQNLDTVITRLTSAHIHVLLVGITLPPNYGPDYVKTFTAIFPALAKAHHLSLMPMIYDGIYTLPGTIQGDGIHPTAKGSKMIAEHILPLVRSALPGL